MLGLAQMAAHLAQMRKGLVIVDQGHIDIVKRKSAENFPSAFPSSAEYYRICDRIARGEKP